MAGSRWFAKIGPTVVPPIDRTLHRVFGGRVLMSSMMLPCAIVTTTGRKSGEPRESPLATVPLDGSLYVVGSNFGKPHHPAWSWNLLADPTRRCRSGASTSPRRPSCSIPRRRPRPGPA